MDRYVQQFLSIMHWKKNKLKEGEEYKVPCIIKYAEKHL